MSDNLIAALNRIAEALERIAPPLATSETFAAARVFRHDASASQFISAPDPTIDLDMLVGVERQKAQITDSMARFAKGLPANHILLWGVRGTGKSSLAKAAFMAVAREESSLRLIEIDRDEISHLPGVFEFLRARPEQFVVLCDDLSFEEGAAAAKALKSALEGGVSGPPSNVLFVATSNRRHLMPRDHVEDRGAIAAAEDAEEEISVSDRFGLWIGFPPMDQTTYLAAVRSYAGRFGLNTANLDRRALQWAQLRGARSGRVAWQFIRDLAGEMGKPLP